MTNVTLPSQKNSLITLEMGPRQFFTSLVEVAALLLIRLIHALGYFIGGLIPSFEVSHHSNITQNQYRPYS